MTNKAHRSYHVVAEVYRVPDQDGDIFCPWVDIYLGRKFIRTVRLHSFGLKQSAIAAANGAAQSAHAALEVLGKKPRLTLTTEAKEHRTSADASAIATHAGKGVPA